MARILIVDDERSIRETLGEFIKDLGHEVSTAAEAVEALEIASQSCPDVVVSDIILPGVDGLALLERLHRISEDIQVVIITGEPTVDTAAVAVRQGAFDYLSKPVSREAIQSAVERALRVKEIVDERSRLAEENLRYREHLEEEVERKTAALAASEAEYRTVVENANEAIFVAQGAALTFANPKTSEITGYSNGDLLAMPFMDLIHPEDRAMVVARYQERLTGGDAPNDYEFRILTAQGDIRWIEIRPVLIEWEGQPATLNFASDITSRKLLQLEEIGRQERIQARNEALMQLATERRLAGGDLEASFRVITEMCVEALDIGRASIWLFEEDGELVACHDLYDRDSGEHSSDLAYRRDAIRAYLEELDKDRSIAIANVSDDPRMTEFAERGMADVWVGAALDAAIRSGGVMVGDVCFEVRSRAREWTHEDEEFAGSIATLIALTLEASRRHEAEAEREKSEARYRVLFENSPISLWQEDYSQTKALLEELKGDGVTDLKARLLANPELVSECIQRIRVVDMNEATVALHGAKSKEEMLGSLSVVIPDEAMAGFVPQLLAIANGEPSYQGEGVDQKLDGRRMHVSICWTVAPGFEKTFERVLVSKVDVTATVEAEAALQAALDGTIEAIGRTTETRDPYTAGHQRRVTELAVAIANELGLAATTIAGIRASGLMHDIGKMAIPAEILSKPSSLSDTEMSLIQSHPQVAYDILESTAFPWPVADIVLQHHERMDGSGYPSGLSGEGIMIEARILSVADTVEAMASHRPYRAALGIDVALEEIRSRKGGYYDADVVEACLRLFAEGRFEFSPIHQLPG